MQELGFFNLASRDENKIQNFRIFCFVWKDESALDVVETVCAGCTVMCVG